MRWNDERYVRVYVRDTGNWIMLGWEGQALLMLALRKADRAGILHTGKNHERGLAAMTGVPLDVVRRVLPMLLPSEDDDGCIVRCATTLMFRNFEEAQEAKQSDAQRSRESRARARDKEASETERVDAVTERVDAVTVGHEQSQAVTTCHSVPSLAVPNLAEPNRGWISPRDPSAGTTEHKPVVFRPRTSFDLIHCMRIAIQREQPQLAYWNPGGTFATKEADGFLSGFTDIEEALPVIEERIEAFAKDPAMKPWTVAKFARSYNGLSDSVASAPHSDFEALLALKAENEQRAGGSRR